jgi:hypothetical protein
MPNESSDPSETSGFYTQTALLKKFGFTRSKGLSVPLSNLYAKQRMGLSKENFLHKSEADIWKLMREEEKNQEDLNKKVGAGGTLFSAFHDANMPYEATQTDDCPSKELLAEVVHHTDHALITFPIRRSKAQPDVEYEQVYLGRSRWSLGTNRCAYFNANKPAGEFTGDCNEVIRQLLEDMQKEAHFDGRPTLYGMAKKP